MIYLKVTLFFVHIIGHTFEFSLKLTIVNYFKCSHNFNNILHELGKKIMFYFKKVFFLICISRNMEISIELSK